MFYYLIILSALLFSLQFLFNQQFEKINGDGFNSALAFSIYTSFTGFILLFLINGFKIHFSFFSFLIAFLYSCINIAFNFVSVKAFSSVNLGLYSVFAMLGGMLLPSIYGIVFNGEIITAPKVFSCVLIALATLLGLTDFEKNSRHSRNIIWYVSVFLLNGLTGVLSAIHQNYPSHKVDSISFIAISRIIIFVICIAFQFIFIRRMPAINFRSLCFAGGFSFLNSIGNLLLLVSLIHLQASVQYPLVTGGTIVFSFFVSLASKQKITVKILISVFLSSAASVIIAL